MIYRFEFIVIVIRYVWIATTPRSISVYILSNFFEIFSIIFKYVNWSVFCTSVSQISLSVFVVIIISFRRIWSCVFGQIISVEIVVIRLAHASAKRNDSCSNIIRYSSICKVQKIYSKINYLSINRIEIFQ